MEDPPQYIWTRQLKVFICVDSLRDLITSAPFQFAGVSNTSALYKRGIRVCTGTGLGAALSTCLQVRTPFDGDLFSSHGLCFDVRAQIGEFLLARRSALSPDPKILMINCDRYLIWIGSDQEKTFGPTISGLIHRNLGPERLTLWDSKKRGMVGISSI